MSTQTKEKDYITKADLIEALDRFKVDLIKWMIGTGVAITAIIVTAIKFLH
ncbi:MAG: hypothetical protein ACUZ8H_08840 [Candidatus Anammoxibacter sp.]